MEDYFIKNTSGELQTIIKTDLEKLKKVNEMHEALNEIVERYPNSPWIINNCKSILKEIKS